MGIAIVILVSLLVGFGVGTLGALLVVAGWIRDRDEEFMGLLDVYGRVDPIEIRPIISDRADK